MSEAWVGKNLFCPCCGYPQLTHQTNNKPVGDFICDICGEEFELKSKEKKIGKKIADGAYATMVERITSTNNPHLFVMSYSHDFRINDLLLIPKFFFVPSLIEKRKPLALTARRAGWVGCNIIIDEVPQQGRISIVNQSHARLRCDVVEDYKRTKSLQKNSIETRGWLYDVLNCVNRIKSDTFELAEIYNFTPILKDKHRTNNNIEAKIRQQLQILRDNGFLEFLGRGRYRRVIR